MTDNIYCDGIHVYSPNEKRLHNWAHSHGIKRCWFHASRIRHYDIPKRRRNEKFDDVLYVTSQRIVEIDCGG